MSLEAPASWSGLAHVFARAMDGDGTSIVNSAEFSWYFDLERSGASCNDGPPFTPPSVEDIVNENLYVFENVSRFVFSAITTEPDAGCQYWPVTPPERFVGPWNHTLSNPILVISNTVRPSFYMVPATSVDSSLRWILLLL